MQELSQDVPGVRFFPPLLFAAPLVLGIVAGRGERSSTRKAMFARRLGVASILTGVAIGAAAVSDFKRAGANIDVRQPSLALATDGVYRYTRNPIYVGLTAVYVGVALRARALPALALLPIVLALLDSGVVDREERYLERRFGDAYRSYRERVPRWF